MQIRNTENSNNIIHFIENKKGLRRETPIIFDIFEIDFNFIDLQMKMHNSDVCFNLLITAENSSETQSLIFNYLKPL